MNCLSNYLTHCLSASDFAADKKMLEEVTAVDEGGPSREFFSRCFHQLGDLEVEGVPLFEVTKYGYIPFPDDYLKARCSKMTNKDIVLNKIREYFRAVGRVFAYCLLHQITVPSNSLPAFYWNSKSAIVAWFI